VNIECGVWVDVELLPRGIQSTGRFGKPTREGSQSPRMVLSKCMDLCDKGMPVSRACCVTVVKCARHLKVFGRRCRKKLEIVVVIHKAVLRVLDSVYRGEKRTCACFTRVIPGVCGVLSPSLA
jgi:hypothetical protein